MTKEQPFTATFKIEKETKNTVRYAEEAEDRRPVVSALYCGVLPPTTTRPLSVRAIW